MNQAINELEYMIQAFKVLRDLAVQEEMRGENRTFVETLDRVIRLMKLHVESIKDNPVPSIVHDRP